MQTVPNAHVIGNESPDPLLPLYPPQIVQEVEHERLPVDDEQPGTEQDEREMDSYPGTRKDDENKIPEAGEDA